jgi:mannose-6-phosphate isomerase-like protein (cupin superfamily)
VEKMQISKKPTKIKALGNPPKTIEEFIGRINTKTNSISIARMKSPKGWSEPFQQPDFEEYSVILKGALSAKINNKTIILKPGQSIIVPAGTRVQYSTPKGAEYISVCVPAFSPDKAHREQDL